MKIQQATNMPLDAATYKSKTGTTAIDFQKLLGESVAALSSVNYTSAVSAVEEVQATSPTLRVEGLALTETAISTLESYQEALSDSRFSPSHLEPYIEAMEEETQGLIGIREQMPDNDPLGLILERAATASYVETAKFRRGDYGA